MNRSFLTGCFLWLCHVCPAQTSASNAVRQEIAQTATDAGRILVLLKWGDFYVNKPGSEKNDLDSAMLLLTQARNLSRQLAFTHEVDHADCSIGQTMVEGRNYTGLHRQFAQVGDSVRMCIIQQLTDFELAPTDRMPGSFDTVVRFMREVLPLFKSGSSLKERFILLQRFAVLNYCAGDMLHDITPSPSWVAPGRAGVGKDWLDPILDWVAAHLRNDRELLAALERCRQELNAAYPAFTPSDKRAWLHDICGNFIGVTCDEATNNFYGGKKELTEHQYLLAIDFDRTLPAVGTIIYNNLASFYILNGDHHKALSIGLEAIRRIDTTRINKHDNEVPYWITGQVYEHRREYARAMEHYQKALSLLHQDGRTPNEFFLGDVMACYNNLDQPGAALAFLKANIDSSRWDNKEYQRVVEDAMGSCYFYLHQYQKAESYWLRSYELNKILNPRQQHKASLNLGKLYMYLKQYDKVKKYLVPLVADSTKAFTTLAILSQAHYFLFRADSATGNYISSIQHLEAHQSMDDSIFNIDKNRQAEELKVKYDIDGKDKDLRLQQAELRNNRYTRNGLIAGAVTLICLLSLLYARFRGKQKSNRLLQTRQQEIDLRNQQLQDLAQRQQRLLREKEWLIREVHHRVKNNLQIIISLLNMQGSYLKDELALDAFGEISSRIRAISLIHQKLYREGMDMAVIDMREYIGELVGFLRDSMVVSTRIRFILDISPIKLGVVQCVPVGLVLNEAVTNAIKYAFPQGHTGHTNPQICITLCDAGDDHLELTIADNGIGMPESISHQHPSMGLELIQILTDQLEGSLTIQNTEGLSIHLHFPKAPNEAAAIASVIDHQYNLSI